uniref:Lipoprotein n=1 Tax=Streptomyces sp. NBC_00003 TaxID=2903608 RepID=A0AAU2V6M3_9ACTN
MRLSRIAAPAVLAVLTLALATACGGGSGESKAEDAPSPVPSVSFPAPKQAAAPAAYQKLAKGEVRLEQGPFTDRVKVMGGALSAGSAVTGHLAVTSDVSELIALELSAAYYDADGKLLGTGSFQYAEEDHDDHKGAHTPAAEGKGIDFEVKPKALTGTPTSAVLSIPVLVNE